MIKLSCLTLEFTCHVIKLLISKEHLSQIFVSRQWPPYMFTLLAVGHICLLYLLSELFDSLYHAFSIVAANGNCRCSWLRLKGRLRVCLVTSCDLSVYPTYFFMIHLITSLKCYTFPVRHLTVQKGQKKCKKMKSVTQVRHQDSFFLSILPRNEVF